MRFFVVCFLHTGELIFLYQTPGRRPSRITGRVVTTTVTRRWVGATNERTSFRIHDAVVFFLSMSVEDSESRRFENKHSAEFSQADLGPRSAKDFFSVFS